MQNNDLSNNNYAIEVVHLTTGYGERIIHDNVSFKIKKGEIVVIAGASGCGKSTLLNHLIGLLNPINGEVFIDGINLVNCSGNARLELLKKCGVLFQSGALLSSMTIAENIDLVLEAHTNLSQELRNIIIDMKLSLLNLSGSENLFPSQLSGGMKKRAGLARAMALDPEILFFDEPSAGLDPISAAELDAAILTINKILGTTMIIVTHDLDSIFNVAQRVIMLDAVTKKIIADDTPQTLKSQTENKEIHDFFNRFPNYSK